MRASAPGIDRPRSDGRPLAQAGGLATVTRTVEGFGGFAKRYEQIEKVSTHHCDLWEPPLYGQIGRDRAVMFDQPEAYDPRLDVDFTPLREQDATTAGFDQAA
ncbi:hypothetical protein HUT19_38850 [Streptomyces sp. NA02950]|uniref:hypothetical protein n=1 Tax=Streptomyces sp. NA02950 TaxID=2742137 RepID=UPI0015904220|nr:hypothetical protein [Streptomyces sp. NA02950]QKV96928.1 hypothetical protein HUT19_38850 [Streptomyces sp. NA02950]